MTNKLKLAREFVAANPSKTRAEYITQFQIFGLTETSASVYHHNLVTKEKLGADSYLDKATKFVAENPGLSRQEYIKAFVAIGMSTNSASLYHYNLVTSVKKPVKIVIPEGKLERLELLNSLRQKKGLEVLKSWKKSGDLLLNKLNEIIAQ